MIDFERAWRAAVGRASFSAVRRSAFDKRPRLRLKTFARRPSVPSFAKSSIDNPLVWGRFQRVFFAPISRSSTPATRWQIVQLYGGCSRRRRRPSLMARGGEACPIITIHAGGGQMGTGGRGIGNGKQALRPSTRHGNGCVDEFAFRHHGTGLGGVGKPLDITGAAGEKLAQLR